MQQTTISLDHGSGGLASQQLISELFFHHLQSPALQALEDCALLDTLPPELQGGRLTMSTDSYVVSPLFFPGGNIGELAVNGTINDLAMRGSVPLGLSLGLIIEEGFAIEELEKIVASIALACQHAEVHIVTGDTKVVPRGKADGIFINTTGIGLIPPQMQEEQIISGKNARPGDSILISGTMGDHGITIMSSQAGLAMDGNLRSDTQSLHNMVAALLEKGGDRVHVLRDPTRGGLATTLAELAEASAVSMEIQEDAVPVRPSVAVASELLGLDPLYLANEGKCIVICTPDFAQQAVEIMQGMEEGREAALIGTVGEGPQGQVSLRTAIGGTRLLEPLTGAPLPRIC